MTTFTSSLSQSPLQPGHLAPDFEAKDQDGRLLRLSQFRGKKVVLYFYPKDDTPGCTAQACNLRDHYDLFLQKGYVVLGVSSDDAASHQAFREKYALPFPLLVDTDKALHQAYGVWVEKQKEGVTYWGTARTTFVIDEEGVLEKIIGQVDTENHTAQVVG